MTPEGTPARVETMLLAHVVDDEKFARRVMPHLKEEYFSDRSERLVFNLIDDYIREYNVPPTRESLLVDVCNRDGVSEETHKQATSLIRQLDSEDGTADKWLLDQAETFCQDRATYNAIQKAIEIYSDKTGETSKGEIPGLLTAALGVSFDTSIGHDFLGDAEARFDFYHVKQKKIPFDLEYLNKITRGGLIPKSLNVFLAGTGVGKSVAMCHMAAANLTAGYSVLYITLEMAEEEIARRIDANLLNVPIAELESIGKDQFFSKINRLKGKTQGRLKIKEYPTASAGTPHFRHLLNELRLKQNFVPDIIYIDYLNICASARVKMSAGANSYTIVKSIAEEIRGLAMEFNVPIVSATQTNREGFSSSDIGMEATSESFGLPMTCDLFIAISTSEELVELGQLMFKQLKNRYNDLNYLRKFVVGVDFSYMRLFDAEESAQEDIIGGPTKPKAPPVDKPVFDKSGFGAAENDRLKKTKFITPNMFAGFE